MTLTYVYTNTNAVYWAGYNVIPPGPSGVAAVGADDATYLDSAWADGSVNGGNPGAGNDILWGFGDTSAITALAGGGTVVIDSVRVQVKDSANSVTLGNAFHTAIYGAYSNTHFAVNGPNVVYAESIKTSALIPGVTTLAQLATVQARTGNVLTSHKINFVRLEVNWHVDSPPVYTAAATNTAQTILVGGGLTAVAATDPDGDIISYSLQSGSLPPGITLNPAGSFAGTATAAGTYNAVIRATSNALTATTTLVVTVNTGNQPPAFTTATTNTNQTVNVGSNMSTMLATDPEGDVITYTVFSGSLPPGITLNTNGTFTGAATTKGTYNAVIRATATGGFASTNIAVTVPNRAPVFSGAATNSAQTITTAQTPTALAGSDPDGDPVTYSVQSGSLPAGITMATTGVFSGVSTISATYPLVVRISDGTLTSTQNLVITVIPAGGANQPPAFTAAPTNTTQAVLTGGTVLPLAASDPENDPMSFFQMSGVLPPGITFNPNGTFSGTATTPGTYVATFRVVATGGQADTVLTFNVTGAAVVPVAGSTSHFLHNIRGCSAPNVPHIVDLHGTLNAGDTVDTLTIQLPSWALSMRWELTTTLGSSLTKTDRQTGAVLGTITPPATGSGTWRIRFYIQPKLYKIGQTNTFYATRNSTIHQTILETCDDKFCRQGTELAAVDQIKLLEQFFCITQSQYEMIADMINKGFNFASMAMVWDQVTRAAINKPGYPNTLD